MQLRFVGEKLGFMRDLFSIWYSTGNIRKSVFIIGIKGLLVAVRGRSISKLSNIMIFHGRDFRFLRVF